jgi:hypothetical protein
MVVDVLLSFNVDAIYFRFRVLQPPNYKVMAYRLTNVLLSVGRSLPLKIFWFAAP